jgi:hypothetical protein
MTGRSGTARRSGSTLARCTCVSSSCRGRPVGTRDDRAPVASHRRTRGMRLEAGCCWRGHGRAASAVLRSRGAAWAGRPRRPAQPRLPLRLTRRSALRARFGHAGATSQRHGGSRAVLHAVGVPALPAVRRSAAAAAPRPSIRAYFRNRFLRVLPGYWLAVLGAGLILQTAYASPLRVDGPFPGVGARDPWCRTCSWSRATRPRRCSPASALPRRWSWRWPSTSCCRSWQCLPGWPLRARRLGAAGHGCPQWRRPLCSC